MKYILRREALIKTHTSRAKKGKGWKENKVTKTDRKKNKITDSNYNL